MRGSANWFSHAHRGHAHHLYFHPVDGRLVFATALILAVMVLIGFALIADKCRCDEK